jgi:hypothetical protein
MPELAPNKAFVPYRVAIAGLQAAGAVSSDAGQGGLVPDTPQSSSAPPMLEYGRVSVKHVWFRRILRAMTALLLLSIGISAYIYRGDVSLRVRRVYWFHQCMTHVTPPGTVLSEMDSAKARELIDSNPDYVDPTTYVPPSRTMERVASISYGPQPRAAYLPRAWREFQDVELFPMMELPTFQGGSSEAVTFIGERRTPAGERRLVVIKGDHSNALNLDRYMQAASLVIRPPSLFESLPRQQTGQAFQFSGFFQPAKLQPGVADPNDLTHLTIDFVIESRDDTKPQRHGILDVRLCDDDTLDFKVRDPATTQGF